MSSCAGRNLGIAQLMIFLLMSATPNAVWAQAPPSVGAEVVIKAGASLKVGERVVDTGASHRLYRVARADGHWLWLVSGPVAGWAKAADVMRLDQAIELYTTEADRSPHSPWPLYNRGIIYQDLRETDKAFADYSEAIRQDAKFVPALINRGNIWMYKRDFARAITDYSEAIQVEPQDVLAHVNRGIAWQAKGDFDKALTDYDDAIRLGHKTPSAYNNRGHVKEMKKDYDGAIADYSEAIRLDPKYALAWINRGNARFSKGDYENALTDFAENVRLTPKSPWGYARRAWVLATCPVERYRNGKEAVELASKACELAGSDRAAFLDVRAAAHAESGDFANAVFWQSKAVVSAPNSAPKDAEVYRARLKLYQEKKPYREELPLAARP